MSRGPLTDDFKSVPLIQHEKAYVYILANKYRTVLYVGVTSDLYNRVLKHMEKLSKNSFTSRYKVTDLVYFEEHESIEDAIRRETQLKNWKRAWKEALIKKTNPEMRSLEDDL
jgi:putative endonuclease